MFFRFLVTSSIYISYDWDQKIPLMVVGGLAFVATSILIPVLIHYSVFKTTMTSKDKCIHFVLGMIAFLVMVISTYFSALSVINSIMNQY